MYHPDKNSRADASAIMIKVNEARDQDVDEGLLHSVKGREPNEEMPHELTTKKNRRYILNLRVKNNNFINNGKHLRMRFFVIVHVVETKMIPKE